MFILAGLSPASGFAGSTDARFNVTVHLAPAGGSMSIAAPSSGAAAAPAGAGPHSILLPKAMEVRTTAIPTRLRFEITDPGVASVDVLGLGRPVHVGNSAIGIMIPPSSHGRSVSISFVIRYREGASPGEARSPIRATFLP